MVTGVDLNFNGWGNKQRPPMRDSAAAAALVAVQLPHLETLSSPRAALWRPTASAPCW